MKYWSILNYVSNIKIDAACLDFTKIFVANLGKMADTMTIMVNGF
jgi:hypothetical protein